MTNNMVRFLATFFVLAVTSALPQAVSGEVITVLSPSFESPLNAGGFFTTVTNWDTDASASQGNVGESINASYGDADSGVMMAFSNVGNTGPLAQTLTETIRKGTYTLTVQVAEHSAATGSSALAGFYADVVGTVVASNTDGSLPLDPTAGNWDTLTVVYQPQSSDIGKTLGIFLDHGPSGSSQVLFDTVTLNFAPAVPEPSSLALAALGLIGLATSRRRTRS